MSETARTPDQIRADIEHTREELADTAAALAEKADVKARAHEKVEETKARAHAKVDETTARVKADPRKPILIAAGVCGVLAAWLILRRR